MKSFETVISQPWVQELIAKTKAEGAGTPALGIASPSETPDALGIVNSRTHPAAYAKLGRRMASMNPSEFPNMQKLWNGNRTDRFTKTIVGILKRYKRTSIALIHQVKIPFFANFENI